MTAAAPLIRSREHDTLQAVSWPDLEHGAPEIARAAHELFLFQDGPAGLGYLATTRRDGGPRVHPISPALHGGRLYAFVLKRTPKCADLHRDGRFALHSWPRPFGEEGFDDEEVHLTGRATPIVDERLQREIAAIVGDDPTSGDLFELAIESAMHKRRRGGLRYSVWRNPRAP